MFLLWRWESKLRDGNTLTIRGHSPFVFTRCRLVDIDIDIDSDILLYLLRSAGFYNRI